MKVRKASHTSSWTWNEILTSYKGYAKGNVAFGRYTYNSIHYTGSN